MTSKISFWFHIALAFTVTLPNIALCDQPQNQPDQPNFLYILSNEDAFFEKRVEALDRLSAEPSDEFYKAVFDVLEREVKTDMSKRFRAHLEEHIKTDKNTRFLSLLADKLGDDGLKRGIRVTAFNLLQKARPEEALRFARRAVENKYELEELRMHSLIYLAYQDPMPQMIEAAKKIAANKSETFKIRLSCLNFLQKNEEAKKVSELYSAILLNPGETPRLQEVLIPKIIFMNMPDFTDILLSIVKNPKYDLHVREIALHTLLQIPSERSLILQDLQYRQIYEKDPSFKESLKTAIDEITKQQG